MSKTLIVRPVPTDTDKYSMFDVGIAFVCFYHAKQTIARFQLNLRRKTVFFRRISAMGNIAMFHRTYFFIPNALWASASGTFSYRLRHSCLHHRACDPGFTVNYENEN